MYKTMYKTVCVTVYDNVRRRFWDRRDVGNISAGLTQTIANYSIKGTRRATKKRDGQTGSAIQKSCLLHRGWKHKSSRPKEPVFDRLIFVSAICILSKCSRESGRKKLESEAGKGSSCNTLLKKLGWSRELEYEMISLRFMVAQEQNYVKLTEKWVYTFFMTKIVKRHVVQMKIILVNIGA